MQKLKSSSFYRSLSTRDVMKIIVFLSVTFVILHSIRTTNLISGEGTTFFDEHIWNHLVIHASFQQWLHQPWTLFTYLMAEMSFMQMLGNMIWLWVFGMVIEDLKGQYHIIPVFFIGGMVGALFLMIANLFHVVPNTFYYGGSVPAVSAVVTATCFYKPKYPIWEIGSLRIEVWMVGVVFLLLIGATFAANSIAHAALLSGGVVTGLVYNYGLTNLFYQCTSLLKKVSGLTSNDKFVRADVRSKNQKSAAASLKQSDEIELNRLLDKIGQHGMDSLTRKEKEALEQLSKQ
ncbi:MAG TPA: rhomboid family intramembrane serine protease [Chitinophagaceae bacterium]|nr:rhomboid family intramembrane serine protease [Chitinophagaceae bacterium]